MSRGSPYLLDRRVSTTPPGSATFPYDRVEENRVFEESTTAANMVVDGRSLLDWTGDIGAAVGGVGTGYSTKAAVEAATISNDVLTICTSGYTTAGDGGNGLYKRINATPFPLWVTGTNYTFEAMFIVNSAGRYYQLERDPGAGASTNEPVHTTIGETVQGADGYGWTHVRPNAGYIRSVDRYKADGTTDATHGGWWKLVPRGGVLSIECLGGVADAPLPGGATGTDNWPALNDALAFLAVRWPGTPGGSFTYTIKFGGGGYRFSAGFDLHVIAHITGTFNSGQSFGGTWLFFPNTVDPFIIGNSTTIGATGTGGSGRPEAAGSIIENLLIWGGGGLSVFTDPDRCMIKMRAQSTLRNLYLGGIPGRGVWIRGGGGDGNVNNWHVDNVYIHEAGSHYFHVEGSDANGGYCTGLVTHGQGGRGGAGILETGGLGCNHYSGCQITGYGNTGVRHNGNLYMLIDFVSDIGGATEPGTDDTVWMYLWPLTTETLAQFPVWVSLNEYEVQSPVHCNSGSSVFMGMYIEAATIASHIIGGAMAIGGNIPITRYSNRFLPFSGEENAKTAYSQAIGTRREHAPGSAEETAHGSSSTVLMGGYGEAEGLGATGGIDIFSHSRQAEFGDARYAFGYRGNDLKYYLTNTAQFWKISGVNTALTFGRSAPVPHILGFTDFAIGDATDSPDVTSRIYCIRATRPSSGSHARGEWVWPQNPTTWGTAAWVCTVDGTPGTWGQVPLWGLTSIDPALPGDMVAENTSNTRLKFKYQGSDTTVRHVDLGLSATGEVTSKPATAPAAGGTFFFGTGSTAGFGVYAGSGAPSASAAKGSLYMRTDGSTTNDRMYVNTDGGTTWTAVTTAA
jgi:hypothetical protein